MERTEIHGRLSVVRRPAAWLLGRLRRSDTRASGDGTSDQRATEGAARASVVWRLATVTKLRVETAHAKTIVFDIPGWPHQVAGQHVDLRLTAEDGYQAERSYSIASAPEDDGVAITADRIPDGEVSPFLNDVLLVGDQIEVRGPFGGYFNWRAEDGGPLLLIAGGSGLVPLMAMIRHRQATESTAEVHLLLSARSVDDVLYQEELRALGVVDGVTITQTFTRRPPPGWDGFARRVDREMLQAVGPALAAMPTVYICGPTAFVEHAAELLVGLGHPPERIRTERFGPTG
jgi:ferredoxin-NADP reductase